MAFALTAENRKWWGLGTLSFTLFMIMMDNTVVNVALPSMQRDLGVDISDLEWVVSGYALTFAVLLLTGGKLADMLGRRFMFVTGVGIFTLASLACGLANSADLLIAGRVVQGVGAALMMPATLSIIRATFPPEQRGMAIGIWAGVSMLGLAIGPLVGGLLTQHIDWSWIFFVNIPFGVIAITAAFLILTESRDTSLEQSLDLPGLLTSGLALLAITYGLIEANTYGWTSARILVLFGAGAAGLVAFVWIEWRRRLPMLDLSLFRSSTYVGASVVALLLFFAALGIFFFISLYLQQVLGYSAVEAGATFLPMTLMMIPAAPVAGKLSDRFGSRWFMTGGLVLLSISMLSLSRVDASSTFWDLLPAFVVGGFGMGLTLSPLTSAALGSVPAEKAGVAGGAVLAALTIRKVVIATEAREIVDAQAGSA